MYSIQNVNRVCKECVQVAYRFFFLQLPFDHHGPVSELSQAKIYTQRCAGPFNWGEAHCAGEKVKHPTRVNSKSHTKNNKTATNQSAAHHGNQEPPGQAPSCTGNRKTTAKRETSSTEPSRYVWTYIEVPTKEPLNHGSLQDDTIHTRPQELHSCTEFLPTYIQVKRTRFRRCETTHSHCHSNRCGHVGHWPRHHHSSFASCMWGRW